MLPRFPPRAQRYIEKSEAVIAAFYENYWRFMTLPETKKILLVAVFFAIGATGFCVSDVLYLILSDILCICLIQ